MSEQTPTPLTRIAKVLAATMCVACILWNIDTPTRLGFAVLTEQYMAFQLGLAVTITFLLFSRHGNWKTAISWPDLVMAAASFAVLMYAAWDFSDLLRNQAYRPPAIPVIGAVVVVAVMEGIRRKAGWALFTIVSIFLVYSLFADKIPGALIGKALSPIELVQYVGFDPSAVFSTPLAVGTIIVLLFVFFGQLLFAAGGGAFFTDLAMASTGRSRGGSAKISVVASALFGSISGSAVSNVVTTGIVTIPLMQRGGYNKTDAGAIEAIASTGGQLTPPIMGAAAFLMAEFLDISYMTVAAAGVIPALLYYVSVFIQVDLIAGRDGGMTYDDFKKVPVSSFVKGIEALGDGLVDVTLISLNSGAGKKVEAQMSGRGGLQYVSLDTSEAGIKAFKEFLPSGNIISLGANENIPGLIEPANIVEIPWVMLTNKDAPEELVYKMTKVIAENNAKLVESFGAFKGGNPAKMAPASSVEYHPGAKKYYDETGIAIGK